MYMLRCVCILTVLFSHQSQTSDPGRHLKKIMSQLESELHFLGDCVSDLVRNRSEDALDCKMLLENVPLVAIYDLSESPDDKKHISSLARLFRCLINVDWLTKCLATCIRTASQKSNEFGPLGGREQEWKKEIDSKSFESIVNR